MMSTLVLIQLQALLILNSTVYYWRIDEVNAGGTTTGPVWNFTTEGPGGAPVSFWTIDMAKDYVNDPTAWFQLDANLVNNGTNSLIYLEDGQTVSSAVIDDIADEFDTSIWNTVNTNFSSPTDRDSNSKVILFLLDIRDDYNPPTFTGYVGGYFFSIDLFSNAELTGLGYPAHFRSNEAEIIYIDINPNDPTTTEFKSTIAHEFQHLVSASQNVIREDGVNLPTWISEGFSMAAESIYQGVAILSSREDWYDNDPLLTGAGGVPAVPVYSISYGYPLVLWNIYPSNGYVVFNNYSLSHLFFAWMRIHIGNNNFFNTIHNNSDNTVQAVIDVCGSNLGTTVDTWPEMIGTWWMANLLGGNGNITGLESYLGANSHWGPYMFSGAGGSVSIYAGGAIHFYNILYDGWSPSGGDSQISYAMGNISTFTSDYTAPYGTGNDDNEIMIVYNTDSGGYTSGTSAPLPLISLNILEKYSAEDTGYLKANGLVFEVKKSLPFSVFQKGMEPVDTELPVLNNNFMR